MSKNKIENAGFLFYPLSANDPNYPNYLERITKSRHFWVSCENDNVIAFVMAYTFSELASFCKLNPNDKAVLEYFTRHVEFDKNSLYIAQIAISRDIYRKGLMVRLINKVLSEAKNSPLAIAEVAESPVANLRSARFLVNRAKFKKCLTRYKDGGQRVSATYLRTI